MSGRKTFVGADILLASEVNGFLMDQTVMVFDDASARDTAIPSPSEGMVVYLKDTDALLSYSGSAWVGAVNTASIVNASVTTAKIANNNVTSAKLGAGTILQVVQTVKTNSFSTSSPTFVDVTGFSVSITPRSTSSRILVIADVAVGHSDTNVDAILRLLRGATAIYTNPGGFSMFGGHITNTATLALATKVFVDSPNTSSAVTYKMQTQTAGGTIHFNRRGLDSSGGGTSLTAIEVAG